ncbi:hypothetical protein NQ315_006450 [Exocentrus adspersus]|uniref:Proteasome subunit beta type-1 n=1 Tax=Exocentrus adspersus TaxID=1586481 RepID=A0AAV8W006_9CUCU|nr:hypothetical protein NQ315_006450 [Exocentrus adspersus]
MSLLARPHYPDYSTAPVQHQFYPYADNGGSVVAIAGDDFVVIGADTRLSAGFSIYTRNQNKLFPLAKTTVLGCSGCWCDTLTLTRILKSRMQMYAQEHNKTMSTTACAQMLSTMLYYKRFFPYSISNVLVGLDNEATTLSGTAKRRFTKLGGSAGALLQPLLDNQIGQKNMEIVSKEPLSQEKALKILKDVFISAAERDIYTGDSVFINIITKDGIQEDKFELRKD